MTMNSTEPAARLAVHDPDDLPAALPSVRVHSSGLWLCSCCMLAHAADGCGCVPNGETHDCEPLSAIPEHLDLAMGLSRDEHDDECPNRDEGAERIDCDCETLTFSWSACDGCSSNLGGERHAFTLFYRSAESADAHEEAGDIDFAMWKLSTLTRADIMSLARRSLAVSRSFRLIGEPRSARQWALKGRSLIGRAR
jgi:hypothetical protein